MSKRIAKTAEEWARELEYIESTYKNRNGRYSQALNTFNKDLACFARYCAMNADFAERDGFSGYARIREIQKLCEEEVGAS